jgi:SAM-dependent methyltransferase
MNSTNTSTENTILKIGECFDPKSGIALVCAYENQTLLSHSTIVGKLVLEVGCGTLPVCFGIPDTQMPKTYLATDISTKLLKLAHRIDKRPVYKAESALNISSPNRSFDLIIMRGILHHLPDAVVTLKRLKRKLKPGGELLIYEPNLSSFSTNLGKWFLKTFFKINFEDSPYGQLSQKTIRQAITNSGLLLKRVWYSSLLAFPLTGDYGLRPIVPNNTKLFTIIVAIDRSISIWLHKIPILAKWLHPRVIFLVKNP